MSAQLTRPGSDAAPVDWALYFASHGLRILPVRAQSKEPRLKDWPNKATTDPDVINAWFGRWPDGNYGICTAGLAVTDIDPGKGGHLWLDDNEQHLPDTWRFKTGSGGWHLIYTAPAGRAVGNRTGIAPGVDIRGNGGQIVGPGSIHPNGTLYEMVAGPEDCDLAAAPACVMKLINGTSPPSASSEDIGDDPFLAYGRAHGGGEDDPAAALQQACAAIQGAPIGEQEITLNNSAIRMARLVDVNALRLDDVVSSLTAAGLAMSNEPGKPPWSRSDIEAKILRAVSDVIGEQPAADEPPESPRAEAPAPRIILTNWTVAKAYTGVPDKEHPVIEGVFMKGTAAILAGIGGAGKTDIDIDLGLKIAMNDDGDQTWLGYSVATSGSVVILTAEDNRGAVHQRIDKLQPMFSMSSNTEKLIVVPIPNVDGLGSPALFDRHARPTDLFLQIEDQIHDIGDVQLFVPDPLRAFCRADINSDPDAATVVMDHLNNLATRQDMLVLPSHHLRKAGIQARSAIEAREAIQGVAGIVDHSRATFCLWMPPQREGEAVLQQLGMDNSKDPFMRVFLAGLVKWNHRDADRSTRTLVRIDETLIDKTTEIVGQHGRDMTPGEYNELKDALHAHIAARANQGRPFTNSSQPPNGILNKANLERLVHNDTRIGSKDDITNLIDSLAIDQKIRFVKEGNSLWIKPA